MNVSEKFIFYDACEKGNLILVKNMLSYNVVDADEDDNIALKLAVKNGHEYIVNHLLSFNGVDASEEGSSALIIAINVHNHVILKTLVTNTDKVEHYVILHAINSKCIDCVKCIIEAVRFDDHNNIIETAINTGEIEIFKLVLDEYLDKLTADSFFLKKIAKADNVLMLNYSSEKVDVDMNYVFRKAVKYGSINIVRTILNSNIALQNNLSFLLAVRNGNEEIVRLLLNDQRVNPADQNNEPIRIAAVRGYDVIFRLLINDQRVTPPPDTLEGALEHFGNVDIVRAILMDGRVDPAFNNSECIELAVDSGYKEVVQMLLDDGRADPARNNNECLEIAVDRGYKEIVKMLLDDGRADPRAEFRSFSGHVYDVIHMTDSPEILKMLLDDGRADPPVIDFNDYENEDVEMYRLLFGDDRVQIPNTIPQIIIDEIRQGINEMEKIVMEVAASVRGVDEDIKWQIVATRVPSEVYKHGLRFGRPPNDSENVKQVVADIKDLVTGKRQLPPTNMDLEP